MDIPVGLYKLHRQVENLVIELYIYIQHRKAPKNVNCCQSLAAQPKISMQSSHVCFLKNPVQFKMDTENDSEKKKKVTNI